MVRGKAVRQLASGVLVVLAMLAFGQGLALAAAPGFPAAPGKYHIATQKAFFFQISADQSVFISVVDEQDETVLKDGGRSATQTTSLYVGLSTAALNANDCYLIPSRAFSFGSGQAAVLTTVDSTNQSCAFPGQTNSLPLPFTVDVAWTGTGPIARTRGQTNFTCGSHDESGSTSGTIQSGAAVATLSPIVSGSLSAPEHQQLLSFDDHLQATGVMPDGCNSIGGIACEPSFPNAGDYMNTSTTAAAFLTDASGRFTEVTVRKDTQSYMECGQPITNDFNVTVRDFDGPVSSYGCFLLAPSDFSNNGVQTAALNVVITDATPTCDGPPTMTLPLTVNLVWTPSSPTAQLSSSGRYDCGTYRARTDRSDMANFDNVTGTLEPLLSGTVNLTGGLTVTTSAVQAAGAKPSGCLTVTGLPI